MARLEDGTFIILDMEHKRARPAEIKPTIKNVASQDGRRVWIRGGLDPGSAGVFEADWYVGELAGYDVEFVRETGSKEVRAMPFASQCRAHKVKLLRGKWNKPFLDELHDFPNGKKDQVDSASGAFSVLCSDTAMARQRFKAAMAQAAKAS